MCLLRERKSYGYKYLTILVYMLVSCNQAISLMRSFIPVLGIKDFQFLDMDVNLIDGGALNNNMLL